MNPDTAELAILPELPLGAVEIEMESVARAGRARGVLAWWGTLAGWWARVVADGERAVALRETWRAVVFSRALVWVAGTGAAAAVGLGVTRGAFREPGITGGFGALGDLLAAPAARWDAAWYLVIARYGYHPALGAYTASRDAFFPLYPLGLGAIAKLGIPAVIAGVMLSTGALAGALYGIHRLVVLELSGGGAAQRLRGHVGAARLRGHGGEVAALAVTLTALAPMAFFFSAVYSESLYLALSVGVFLSARRGRWAWAGVLGALAGATRSTGLVLVLPALIIYLYGPREDRPPDFARDGGGLDGLMPRYRLRREAGWLLLAPAGIVLYGAYLGLAGGDPLAPLRAQEVWGRHFAGPFGGVWDGLRAAFESARQLMSLQRTHLYLPTGGESASIVAGRNLVQFGFLVLAIPAVVGVLRRLPLAYGAYVVAALALPLSYPIPIQPLMSLSRFLLVLFPLTIWLAIWLVEHPRAKRPAVVVSGALMMVFAAQFATWHWVG